MVEIQIIFYQNLDFDALIAIINLLNNIANPLQFLDNINHYKNHKKLKKAKVNLNNWIKRVNVLFDRYLSQNSNNFLLIISKVSDNPFNKQIFIPLWFFNDGIFSNNHSRIS